MVDLAPGAVARSLRGNHGIATRLEEVAQLLEEQQASRFRIEAWRRGAATLRQMPHPVADILDAGGLPALEALPTIGPTLARAIEALVRSGRLPMLDRLRGESDPVKLLATVPGIGPVLADRLHEELGVETLHDLELAAHDGRLSKLPGFGEQRLTGVRDALAGRLGRVRSHPGPVGRAPAVSELLDVDAEYRRRSKAGSLPRIAPRRFNPTGAAWLPVLHTARGDRQYAALFSNTGRAHRLHRTDDWVVIYHDGAGPEGQCTVVTAREGALRGRRVVRGREGECLAHYRVPAWEEMVSSH
jgi:DNA polymerase (family X)